MGLSNKPSYEAGSFSCRHSHHPSSKIFTARGFEALFLRTGTLGSVVCLAPQLFLPVYLHTNVGPLGPPPRHTSSLPWLRVSPLPPVWMNVFSLTTWLLDFYTVPFSVISGCFLFLNFFVVLLLIVQGSKVYLPMPPSFLEVFNFL